MDHEARLALIYAPFLITTIANHKGYGGTTFGARPAPGKFGMAGEPIAARRAPQMLTANEYCDDEWPPCEVCGESMPSQRGTRKTCSKRCRSKLARMRARQQG